MADYSKTELGEIKIHKNVISSIATQAIAQIPGVVRIGSSLMSQLLNQLGLKQFSAIAVEFDKNHEVTVTVPIVVKFGYNIPEVAGHAQESIKSALEQSINTTIKDIHIIVQEIERGA